MDIRMNFRPMIASLAAGALAFGLAFQTHAGNIFVTGHDSDEHANAGYMGAGLDYLLFGAAATPAQRAGKSIALLDNSGGSSAISALLGSGWGTATLFDTDSDFSAAFSGFDAIMTASGNSSSLNSALIGASSSFASFFNGGGSLYINTDEGFGQNWYDFVPSFGTAVNNSISETGVFAPTAAGLAIGLTDPIVDADPTHSFYDGVDTGLFTIFEVTDSLLRFGSDNGKPVAFGARNLGIGGGGFTGGGPSIPEPGTLVLVGVALLGWAGARNLRRRDSQS